MNLHLEGLIRDEDPDLVSLPTASGLRSRDPADLRAELQPILWDYGITRVAHITGFDCLGVPVHMALKPQGFTLSSGSGKGITPEASWLSAVMEASEQTVWEGLERSDIVATERALEQLGHTVMSGARFPHYRGGRYHADLPIAWRTGWDIVHGETVFVPDNLVTPSRDPFSPLTSGSNGLASGGHVLEAVLSGLQEVIERDGLVLNTMVRHAPAVDADDLLEQRIPDIMATIAEHGVELEVLDTTSELGIPTMVSYLYDAPGGTVGSFKGSGTASDTGTALVRAVTEAFQSRCLIVAGARDDHFRSNRRSAIHTPRAAQTREHALPPLDVRDHRHGNVQADLEWMVQRLCDHGFDRVVVIRHTPPGDVVQVVRVLVPGLEGYPFSGYVFGPRARAFQQELEQQEMGA